MVCTLCKHPAYFFGNFQNRNYNRCTHCASVFLDANDLPSATAEQKRYQNHQNDKTNSGYIHFLEPLLDAIVRNHSVDQTGLDFGSGPNPVLTELLREKGFTITPYDLFFSPDKEALKQTYDYMVCCEVIEHFHYPSESFQQLADLLNPGGSLYCKTNLLKPDLDFEYWWYKNDFTHSFFYTIKALEFIKTQFKFSELKFDKDFFQFIK